MTFALLAPIVRKTAISCDFSFTNITRLEIILNDATRIINVRIKNITFLSTFNAETNEEFNGCVYVKYNEETGKTSYAYFYKCNTVNDTSGCFTFSNNTVYGFNNTDASCATGTFTLPTFINGKKVRYVEANTIADKAYFANATKIDLSKALFLERIGEKALHLHNES